MAHPTRSERRILPGAVRRIRTLSRKTQADIATTSGIDFTIISRVENGQRQISLERMIALAEALACDLDDISYMANVYVVCDHEPASVA